jgi:hypothetical protein
MTDVTTVDVKNQFCTYWDGKISWLERLCLTSVRHAGFNLTVFTSTPQALRDELPDFDIVDIREVIPDTHIAYIYREQRGGLRVFSDIARLYMLLQGRGIWTDADCIFQHDVSTQASHMFGWISPKRLNNAVLYLPAQSSILNDYISSITALPLRSPWATLRVRLFRDIEILLHGNVPRDAGRSSIGPRALTYFVIKHGLQDLAVPPDVYYPVLEYQSHVLVDADDRECRSLLTHQTQIVHAWQGTLKGLGALDQNPVAGSFAASELKRIGL